MAKKDKNSASVKAFVALIQAELNYYNSTCDPRFKLTMQDVIDRLQTSKKK